MNTYDQISAITTDKTLKMYRLRYIRDHLSNPILLRTYHACLGMCVSAVDLSLIFSHIVVPFIVNYSINRWQMSRHIKSLTVETVSQPKWFSNNVNVTAFQLWEPQMSHTRTNTHTLRVRLLQVSIEWQLCVVIFATRLHFL